MARLPAGTLPTPVKDRLKRYRTELEARGGRRCAIELEKEATDALALIQSNAGLSMKDAMTEALIAHARVLEKRKRPVASPDNFLLAR